MHYRSRIPLTGALALAACLALFLPDPTSAEMYQWTDKAGNKGFADSLEKVPPQYRNSAKRLEETKGSTKTFQRVPTPPGLDNTMPSAPTDEGESQALWQQRMTEARAELEDLRAKRQKAQEEYDKLLHGRNMRSRPLDPETEAKVASKVSALDQKIRDKEYEISTTIPDEARRAGVPHGALAP
jgi:hypothetical protein